MIGEALGDHKLVAQLGSGSMGVVFLAEHERNARRVAIKVLMPEPSENAEVLHRFSNEARATTLIRHPGIVEVFDCPFCHACVHPRAVRCRRRFRDADRR